MKYFCVVLLMSFVGAFCVLLCGMENDNRSTSLIYRETRDNVYKATKGQYCILIKDIPFANQVKRQNTIYEIRDVFDLNKQTIKLPKGSILCFRGGGLTNGKIIGVQTLIESPNYQVFLDGCQVAGTFSNSSFNADWFNSIQDAINIASENSGIIQLSAKKYHLNASLIIKKGVTITGCGNEAAFLDNRGTIISYSGSEPVIILKGTPDNPAKNITIRNLKIRGNGKDCSSGTNVGIYIGPKAYYCKFENISLYACSNGVEMDNSWNLNFESVNPYYCKNGYFLNGRSNSPLTTTTFNTCVAYNCEVGFHLASDMNAVTLVSCGTDGCATSMELAGCYGVSIISYEFEQHTKCGIHIDNPDCYATFVGLSPRGPKIPSVKHIIIERVGGITFTDMYISKAVIPENGYAIDVWAKSAPKVIFNNCVIKGKTDNLKNCQFVGINNL